MYSVLRMPAYPVSGRATGAARNIGLESGSTLDRAGS